MGQYFNFVRLGFDGLTSAVSFLYLFLCFFLLFSLSLVHRHSHSLSHSVTQSLPLLSLSLSLLSLSFSLFFSLLSLFFSLLSLFFSLTFFSPLTSSQTLHLAICLSKRDAPNCYRVSCCYAEFNGKRCLFKIEATKNGQCTVLAKLLTITHSCSSKLLTKHTCL